MNSNLLEYQKAAIWYQNIRKTFDFDQNQDIFARDLLYSFRRHIPIKNVIEKLQVQSQNKTHLFFGAGPSLTNILPVILQTLKNKRQHFYLTSADGATLALNEQNIFPDLLVTDLDGITNETLNINLKKGSIASILGHGDNMDRINSLDSTISSTATSSNLLCTTQVSSRVPIINPGGFTDGDRGPFLLHHLSSPTKPFYMIGYDFGHIIGKYSKPNYIADQPMTKFKQQKLTFCQKLLTELSQELHRNLIFINTLSQCETFNLMK